MIETPKPPSIRVAGSDTEPPRAPAPRRAITAFVERLGVTRDRLGIARELLRKKPIVITLFGDEYCRATHRSFNRRHPKFPLVRRNAFGAALRDLDVPFESLFAGPAFAYLRRRVRRAEKLGYRVKRIDPIRGLEAIMRINASSAVRQGRAMLADYLDQRRVAAYHSHPGPWYGVVDAQGVLRAYCHLPTIGDCCVYSRILGDAGRLGDGIMYLLVHHTIRETHRLRSRQGYPRWVMYDMFLGGTAGLRAFKRHAGFRPERVSWTWDGTRPGRHDETTAHAGQ